MLKLITMYDRLLNTITIKYCTLLFRRQVLK